MKIVADVNCFLTESDNVSLDKRTFSEFKIVSSLQEVSKWKQITKEEKISMESQKALFDNQDITSEYLEKVNLLLQGIKNNINSCEMSDEEVIRNKSFYPLFEEVVETDLPSGFKFSCDDNMFEVLIPHHVTKEMRPTMSAMVLSDKSETTVKYYRIIGG
mgnify:CR=1 FL=1